MAHFIDWGRFVFGPYPNPPNNSHDNPWNNCWPRCMDKVLSTWVVSSWVMMAYMLEWRLALRLGSIQPQAGGSAGTVQAMPLKIMNPAAWPAWLEGPRSESQNPKFEVYTRPHLMQELYEGGSFKLGNRLLYYPWSAFKYTSMKSMKPIIWPPCTRGIIAMHILNCLIDFVCRRAHKAYENTYGFIIPEKQLSCFLNVHPSVSF